MGAHALADAFIRDVLDLVLRDGRPFALLGCCIGARLCYEIARRRSPVRLYVAGRAAPHCGARGQPQEFEGGPMAPDMPSGQVAASLLQWARTQGWGNNLEDDPHLLEDLAVGWTELHDFDM